MILYPNFWSNGSYPGTVLPPASMILCVSEHIFSVTTLGYHQHLGGRGQGCCSASYNPLLQQIAIQHKVAMQ